MNPDTEPKTDKPIEPPAASGGSDGAGYGGAQYRQESDDYEDYRAGQGQPDDTRAPNRDEPARGHPGNNPSAKSDSAAAGGSTSGGATTAAPDSRRASEHEAR